jgi:hypothetical protein
MHNSESKLTGHFGPIETSNPKDCEAQFSVIFFLQDNNRDYSALDSLRLQTLFHWELIIVSSPTSRPEHRHELPTDLGGRNAFYVDYEMLWEFLNSRPTKYLAFLQQETIWHSVRLAHDYHLLESTFAPAVLSVPLVWSTERENAFVPGTSMTRNSTVLGRHILQQLAEERLAYFGLDIMSVRRSKLLDCSLGRYTAASVALLRLLQSNDVHCSDKCLSERRSKPVHELEDLVAAARELLPATQLTQ